jgi:hypothetical protein
MCALYWKEGYQMTAAECWFEGPSLQGERAEFENPPTLTLERKTYRQISLDSTFKIKT